MNQEEKINRNEFLKKIGFSGAALFAIYTLDSCTNDSAVTPAGTTITLDLTTTANAKLKTSGNYVINNGVVIANNNGTYIAATLTCSHEGKQEITFKNGEWYCTAHGARFSTTGSGLNTEGKKGLTIYKTTLTGNILTLTT
jgi:cytochrome b6-f complex iron-sulfur subunit